MFWFIYGKNYVTEIKLDTLLHKYFIQFLSDIKIKDKD